MVEMVHMQCTQAASLGVTTEYWVNPALESFSYLLQTRPCTTEEAEFWESLKRTTEYIMPEKVQRLTADEQSHRKVQHFHQTLRRRSGEHERLWYRWLDKKTTLKLEITKPYRPLTHRNPESVL